ncbi:MAG: zinc ribbon domain-containing protein, partial [Tissierellia bacterium]|nr:zinc ribbon domain-containing protein [Tissierellia bacterium]
MREKILQDLGCKSDRENRGEDMYCESCGKKIPDESRFCEYCGSKVIPISVEYSAGEINDETDYDQDIKEEILNTELTESNGTKVEEIAKIEETTEVEKTSAEQVIRISENVTMSSEGSYNWMYEFSLWKNPAIMITVSKVLLI